MKVDVCRLCAGPVEDSFTSIDDGTGLCRAGYTYSHCRPCDYYFINPQPDLDALRTFYNSHAILADRSGFEATLAAPPHDVPLPNTGGVYLDFGCNIGLLLSRNKHRFSDVYGVEINNEAAAFAAEKFGIRTIYPTIDALPDVRFALVSLIDVIEHVPDPVTLIETLVTMLAPGGVIFLRLPVTDGVLFSRHRPERWKFVYAPYHLSLFSAVAIESLARRAGLKCAVSVDKTMLLQTPHVAMRMDSLVPLPVARNRVWRKVRSAAAKLAAPVLRAAIGRRAMSETLYATLTLPR